MRSAHTHMRRAHMCPQTVFSNASQAYPYALGDYPYAPGAYPLALGDAPSAYAYARIRICLAPHTHRPTPHIPYAAPPMLGISYATRGIAYAMRRMAYGCAPKTPANHRRGENMYVLCVHPSPKPKRQRLIRNPPPFQRPEHARSILFFSSKKCIFQKWICFPKIFPKIKFQKLVLVIRKLYLVKSGVQPAVNLINVQGL